MTPQEEILRFVTEWFGHASSAAAEKGLDARTVSEQLGIWQNDVSAALNSLAAAGKLRKTGSRPIRYFPANTAAPAAPAEKKQKAAPAENAEEFPAFQRIIGYNGSLSLQTQLAKAGASYPPNGMDILIIGESGVGKSLMAEEIWRYMNQNRPAGTPEKPFVIFNCAEYAENPQFLLSQLFGYEKGAYTGAESAHAGLVERANGGVLFLDEIHRLPGTGQEMLFTLLDKGVYRRLGASQDRTAKLMLIGATTENPEASFLKTFRRRIPMVIEIPPLAERPAGERVDLIMHFLKQESKRLNLPIQVTSHALRLLVSHQSATNIGDLKNEIQLCCARGYLTYRNEEQRTGVTPPYIEFNSGNLSRQVQGNQISEETSRYLDAWLRRHSVLISPDTVEGEYTDGSGSADLYAFIEERLKLYQKEHMDANEIGQMVSLDMQRRMSRSSLTAVSSQDAPLNIYDSVTDSVMAAAAEVIRLASNKFNYIYSDTICNILALYLQQVKFQGLVNQAYTSPQIQQIANAFDGKKRFVRSVIPMLNKALEINLTEDEITIIAMLLETHDTADAKKHIGLIIMGHGESTASSVANFVNEVLLTNVVRSVDVPISLSPAQALDTLCATAAQVDAGKGVIVLTDSDNYEFYEKQLRIHSGIRCRVAPFMNVLIALELCKSIITTDNDLDAVFFNCLNNYHDYVMSIFSQANLTEGSASPAAENESGRNVILVSCITGTGSARKIREWLLQFPAIYTNAEIIPIGFRENIRELADRLGSRLKIIIGITDPEIQGVPFISMEHVTSKGGINRISLILKGWNSSDMEARWSQEELPLHIRFHQIAQRLSYFAPSIDPVEAAKQADYIVREVRALCPKELPDDLQVRIYIHVVSMFERLKTQEPMPMPEDETGMLSTYPEFFREISGILNIACKRLQLEPQPSEAYYLLLALPLDEML